MTHFSGSMLHESEFVSNANVPIFFRTRDDDRVICNFVAFHTQHLLQVTWLNMVFRFAQTYPMSLSITVASWVERLLHDLLANYDILETSSLASTDAHHC
jgi:hypothetical protein